MLAVDCINKISVNPCEHWQKMGRRSTASACACKARTLPPHLSFPHKAAHDTHKDAVTPATLCPRVHEAQQTGRRDDELVSCGEHEAPQKALQMKRQKLGLHGDEMGKGRLQLRRALHMDPERSAAELARE